MRVQTIDDFPAGPFTRADLDARGVSRWDLECALRSRVVRRLVRGVYVRSDQPDDVALRCEAVRSVISRHSVVCSRTAAWLHGIDVLDLHELEILPAVETAVARFTEPTRRADHAGCTRDLARTDVTQVHGVRVTTPLRTALDLGCSLSPRSALAALDAFAREHALTREQLEREALRFRRRRGVVQLRSLIPLIDPRAESPGESWVRYELVRAGLPVPEPQYWVSVDGVATYRLDLAYPLHRIVIEYDGEEFHREPVDREHDDRRREWLRDHGWIVVVVTRRELDQRSCEAWTREVLAGIRSRSRH